MNTQVVADARARGTWVNSATDPASSDFVLPAVYRHERIELAVGTGGASPIATGHIRDLVAVRVDDAIREWADLLAGFRDEIRNRTLPDSGATLFRLLAEPGWIDRVWKEGMEAVA